MRLKSAIVAVAVAAPVSFVAASAYQRARNKSVEGRPMLEGQASIDRAKTEKTMRVAVLATAFLIPAVIMYRLAR